MKKTILTLTFTLATMTFCNAQKIEVEKVLLGYKYTQNGNPMSMKDLVKTMEPNQQAFSLIKKAQLNNTFASIIGFVGGFLIGWPIGTAIRGDKANWTLAGIGAGIAAIGIPFSSSANKQARQAVELYNSSFNSASFYKLNSKFKIVASGNGIGLSINF